MIMLLLGLTLFVGYEFLWPVEVIVPTTQPYKVLTPQVKAGDSLIYIVDACKKMNASTTVVRRFVDHVVLSQPSEPSNIRVGCGQTEVTVVVPKLLTPGTWYLALDISYQINPFRSKEYHLRTEDFQVIK